MQEKSEEKSHTKKKKKKLKKLKKIASTLASRERIRICSNNCFKSEL